MKKIKYTIGVLLLLFIGITILVCTNHMTSFDDFIYNNLISLRSNFLDTFFKVITMFGNTLTVIIIMILLFFSLKKKEYYPLLITVLTTVTTNQILKHIIRRVRPDHLRLIKENGYSYPSGHSMISIALYGTFIYLVMKYIKNKTLKISLLVLLTLIILGIGISRIYVGVHYPSDILGGYTLSLIILIVIQGRWYQYDKNGRK